MRRYLVVAHRTIGSSALLDEVRQRIAQGPSSFHLVVPITHPADHVWTEGEVQAEAQARLDAAIAAFTELGAAEVSGEIGDINPVHAVHVVFDRDTAFDGVIMSTLPAGPSRWLKLDAPSRLRKELTIPFTHVVGDREPAST
ncbi:MAG TPA: hypothetical protein VHA73_06715 [Acidimicrobiales bacterium]|jgi:hypothetical protein|nr:hypothetical protein [Acidimicrobiales bacterium]